MVFDADQVTAEVAKGIEKIQNASNLEELKAIKTTYAGADSAMTKASKAIGSLPVDQKKEAGKLMGKLRADFGRAYGPKEVELKEAAEKAALAAETVDMTLPVNRKPASATVRTRMGKIAGMACTCTPGALAIKTFKPEVRVIGAIPEGSPAWKDSLAAGRVSPADHVVTSAEGVAVKHPGDLPFALINEFLDDLVTVTERDINEMILLMLEKHKLVVEAAGAVSLAALEHLNLRSRKFAAATGPHVVVPIMSGGNIDTVTMGAVIQKGMIARGRIMNFEVELPDTPGQLVKVATLLAEQRANVIQLDHDQFKASGHYTNAVSLGVTVETNGPEHIDRILAALREAGFQPKRIY